MIREGASAGKFHAPDEAEALLARPEIALLAREFEFEWLRKSVYSADPVLSRYFRLKFNQPRRVQELIQRLKRIDYVEDAEPVELMRSQHTPNDLNRNQWGLSVIRAEQAWDLSRGSQEVVVAVVDDAVLTTHLDLAPNVWVNPGEIPANGVDDDRNGVVDDVNGADVADRDGNPNPPARATAFEFSHGTHCAGIVSAASDNTRGIASIGYSVRIMAVKCKPDGESGPSIPFGFEGVNYAIEAGADVISLSWGGYGTSNFGRQVIDRARQRGVVVVAAAGNDNVNYRLYPAAYDNVIGVGASDLNDRKANFSNYGDYVDVMAPGVQILSTVPGVPANNAYEYQSGTSMACPLVAGLVGLLKSYNPDLTPQQLTQCLFDGCVNVNGLNPQYAGQLGRGRIDALAALQCVGPPTFDLDLAVREVVQPGRYTCEQTVQPVIDLYNAGTETITSFRLSYQLDDEEWQSLDWNGTLLSHSSMLVELPVWAVAGGSRSIQLHAALPNGRADQNDRNDSLLFTFQVNDRTLPMPFTENFESFANEDPETRNPNGWSTENPDNGMTWGIFQIDGNGPGIVSAGNLLYRYTSQGQRDGLVTPPIDLSGYSDLRLSFKHAYRRSSADIRDSIVIYVSDDCGETFHRVFEGGGGQGFATGTILNRREFVPQNSGDWCGPGNTQNCFTVNLNEWAGRKLIVKFETFNANGNNIFLDDINLTGTFTPTPPQLSVVSSRRTICAGDTVRFLNSSLHAGDRAIHWRLSGGQVIDSTSRQIIIRFDEPGNYGVGLTYWQDGEAVERLFGGLVEVVDGGSISFSKDTLWLCADRADTILVSSARTYSWFPSQGISRLDAAEFAFQPDTFTVYRLMTTNEAGCTATAELPVYVSNVRPMWNVEYDDSLAPDRVKLADLSAGDYQRTWFISRSDSVYASYADSSIEHVFPDTGFWQVRLRLDDGICPHEFDTTFNAVFETVSRGASFSPADASLYPVPVPAGGTLWLEWEDAQRTAGVMGATWFDLTGRSWPARIAESSGPRSVVSVPDLPAGLYFLRVLKGGQFRTFPVLVE